MSHDDEIEALLRRYRPSGPPPALRARCVTPPPPARWPYFAAAALLVVTAGTYRASATLEPQALRPGTATEAAQITVRLGSGPDAEAAAHAAISRFRIDEMARRARAGHAVGPDEERFLR